MSGGRNTAALVRARLLNMARTDQRDFTLVLTRYALERLLYRLSISEHADHFLLKGALLFDLCSCKASAPGYRLLPALYFPLPVPITPSDSASRAGSAGV